jgi:hypothetical protein
MTFEKFCEDDKTEDAVIRNFEIIGEAAGHIPLEIQEISRVGPGQSLPGCFDLFSGARRKFF